MTSQILHAPFVFSPSASANEEASNLNFTEGDWDSDITPHTKGSNDLGKTVTWAYVEKLFKEVLPEEVYNDLVKDKLADKYSAINYKYHGYVLGLNIHLNKGKGGVNFSTPKHEIFHCIFKYVLNDEGRRILLEEQKEYLEKKSKGKVYDLENEEDVKYLNESMSEIYGATWNGKVSNPDSKWSTKKGIIGRFFRFLDRVFNAWTNRTPSLNRMMYKIDHGYYKDIEMSKIVADPNFMAAEMKTEYAMNTFDEVNDVTTGDHSNNKKNEARKHKKIIRYYNDLV
jgi:hypothetical protein